MYNLEIVPVCANVLEITPVYLSLWPSVDQLWVSEVSSGMQFSQEERKPGLSLRGLYDHDSQVISLQKPL